MRIKILLVYFRLQKKARKSNQNLKSVFFSVEAYTVAYMNHSMAMLTLFMIIPDLNLKSSLKVEI